jgi:manganese/zinc/iron transport system permease protein
MRGATRAELLSARSWSPGRLSRELRRAVRAGLLYTESRSVWRLTEEGLAAAARVVRNHRLWELFLIRHADIAPSHVDRDADEIEHVLGDEMVRSLEAVLRLDAAAATIPASPHAVRVEGGAA